jgi:RNA 3'-terminal phosphate cyclase (ATP)
MITIDGSQGEGGGQILRTSLALSLVTGQPFGMEQIRAKRQKQGLLKQHLTAVEAAKTVGCAEVKEAAFSSQTLEFRPGSVTPGNYRFAVGTAGSATLVLQTVLPALLTGWDRSTLTLEGGTHNPLALRLISWRPVLCR